MSRVRKFIITTSGSAKLAIARVRKNRDPRYRETQQRIAEETAWKGERPDANIVVIADGMMRVESFLSGEGRNFALVGVRNSDGDTCEIAISASDLRKVIKDFTATAKYLDQ